MSLITPDELRKFVSTGLDDDALAMVIAKVEADVSDVAGEPQNEYLNAEITEMVLGYGKYLFLSHPVLSVVSVTEYYSSSDTRTVAASGYRVWSRQGKLERIGSGGVWAQNVEVVYRPVDDRVQRKIAVIDLARLEIERTAMKSESIGGEYSFTAPDWEAERDKILDRMRFVEL